MAKKIGTRIEGFKTEWCATRSRALVVAVAPGSVAVRFDGEARRLWYPVELFELHFVDVDPAETTLRAIA